MSEIDIGGSAFPIPAGENREGHHAPVRGMTLRDFFAAKALQGMLAAGNQWSVNDKAVSTTDTYAATAYDFADAMLAARTHKEPKE